MELWASLVAQLVKKSACNAEDPGSIPGSGEDSWRRVWQPIPIFLPGEPQWTEEPGGQRVRHNWVTKHSTAKATVFLLCQGGN